MNGTKAQQPCLTYWEISTKPGFEPRTEGLSALLYIHELISSPLPSYKIMYCPN